MREQAVGERGQIGVAGDDARPGWSRLVLGGRITVAGAAQLREAALEISASGKSVSVCCAGVEYLDAAAIQVLLCLGRELLGRDKQCDITNVPDALRDLFHLVGLGRATDPRRS